MKRALHIFMGIAGVWCLPLLAQAEPILKNPLGDIKTLDALLYRILDVVIQIGMPVVVLMIVWTGLLFVTAQGNPGKLTNARKALGYTLLGALIVLGSYGISALIRETVDSIKNKSSWVDQSPTVASIAYEKYL